MDPLVQDFFRGYLISQAPEEGEPGFRKPSEVDPGGAEGMLLPVFIEPIDGAPAPGQRTGTEDNKHAVISLVYTGGFVTGPYEKFRRKETYDLWIRSKTPQLAKIIDNRLWKLLHDKRDWDMAGLTVIESMQWRPLQPIGTDPGVYSFICSYVLELYSETGDD